jgi:hypothetical protein
MCEINVNVSMVLQFLFYCRCSKAACQLHTGALFLSQIGATKDFSKDYKNMQKSVPVHSREVVEKPFRLLYGC